MNTNPTIFSSKILPKDLSSRLHNAGFTFSEKDFINVNLDFEEESFAKRINNPDAQARIFTSKNAVFSLQMLLKARKIDLQSKKNFTVGLKATEMLDEIGIKTNAKAGNAISLAQIIARNKDVKSVDFFCGNKSLDDLPEYLESKGIEVHKEIVYKTELVHHIVETEAFNGVIFLSPTAVYSFFKKNKLKPNVPAFCIGATTSEAVHFRCDNQRIIANEPSIESVVDKVIEHFTNEPN